jgi:Chemotaxis protein; stimulates methylation of MCP proteins
MEVDRIIGIGEMVISSDKSDKLKTFALASCIAVTAYSPLNHTAGMIHIALPTDPVIQKKEINLPAYYATSGVPCLIEKMIYEYGCNINELEIELFGAAKSIHKKDIFHIGQKNLYTVKQLLNNMNLRYKASETGGSKSRTLIMDVETGYKEIIYQQLII